VKESIQDRRWIQVSLSARLAFIESSISNHFSDSFTSSEGTAQDGGRLLSTDPDRSVGRPDGRSSSARIPGSPGCAVRRLRSVAGDAAGDLPGRMRRACALSHGAGNMGATTLIRIPRRRLEEVVDVLTTVSHRLRSHADTKADWPPREAAAEVRRSGRSGRVVVPGRPSHFPGPLATPGTGGCEHRTRGRADGVPRPTHRRLQNY
jgi:hypothetical protein